jgi:uncharacterized protein
MGISLYDIAVPGFIQTVGAMEGVLQKGAAYCKEQGIDTNEVVETRVHPDMFPFRFQIFSLVNHSIGAIDAVKAGVFNRPEQRPPLNYTELQALLAETSARLKALTPAEINALEAKDVVFAIGDTRINFKADGFLLSFSLPNLHFHAATAYGILRARGVQIGKRDFLGKLRVAG